MNISRLLTPAQYRPARTMTPTSITIHNTANPDAGAQQHAKAQSAGNLKNVAVHYYADDRDVYQCLEDNWQGWHAGDGSNPKGGNYTSIGIEVCEQKGIDQKKAFELAAELTRALMKKHGIGLGNVVQHNHWTGKDCPHILRAGKDGMTWAWFAALCKTPAAPPPPPVDPNKPSDWAAEAWDWAKQEGYMDGTNPKGDMTREMMAQLLYRLYSDGWK